jgi:hypothetical protein
MPVLKIPKEKIRKPSCPDAGSFDRINEYRTGVGDGLSNEYAYYFAFDSVKSRCAASGQ